MGSVADGEGQGRACWLALSWAGAAMDLVVGGDGQGRPGTATGRLGHRCAVIGKTGSAVVGDGRGQTQTMDAVAGLPGCVSQVTKDLKN